MNSPVPFKIAQALSHGSSGIRDLSRDTGYHKNTVSDHLRHLESIGIVELSRINDKGEIRVSLTEQGEEFVGEVVRIMQRWFE